MTTRLSVPAALFALSLAPPALAQKPTLPAFHADPSAHEWAGRYWIYSSHDLAGSKGWDMVDWHASSSTTKEGVRAKRPPVVAVPEGDGAPVITDGLFSPGEWDDALAIPMAETVTLHLKQYRGVVFVGVRGRGAAAIGPSELSLAASGGEIQKLHVSAQLSESVLPASGPEPSARFGLTTGWYANELRRDMEEAARLQKEGLDPIAIMRATSYPSDGIEFAIRRSKVPGGRWLLRLWASAIVGDKPGMLTYPPEAAERSTDRWQELRLE